MEAPEEKALAVEQALDELYAIKDTWEIEDVRSHSDLIYNLIFEAYNEEEENGITTPKYTFLEEKQAPKENAETEGADDSEEMIFTLKLK